MNCRSNKLQQHLVQENDDSKINLSRQHHHALQIKRKRSKAKENTINEENEQYEVDVPQKSQNKRAKCENGCPNCCQKAKGSSQITNETKSAAAVAVVVVESQEPTPKHSPHIDFDQIVWFKRA
jgi:hypothetical protein